MCLESSYFYVNESKIVCQLGPLFVGFLSVEEKLPMDYNASGIICEHPSLVILPHTRTICGLEISTVHYHLGCPRPVAC